MTDASVLSVMFSAELPMSRSEIAHETGLSKPAVSASATRLAGRGILREGGVREGRRGGVATLFQVNADYGRSLAVIIQNGALTVQSQDLMGTVRAELWEPISPDAGRVQLIAATNGLLTAVSRKHRSPVLAVAISIADPVDARTGAPLPMPRERSAFPAGLIRPAHDLDLPSGVDVIVDNDVNWAALGEARDGTLRGCATFLYVYIGEGLGMGLVLDGQLFRGNRGLAGEIGYMRVSADSDLTQSLAALGLGGPLRYGINPGKLQTLDPAVVDEVVALIATVITNATILINPEAVALGGPLGEDSMFVGRVTERVRELSLDPPTVVASTSMPLLGAAWEAHARALRTIGVGSGGRGPSVRGEC